MLKRELKALQELRDLQPGSDPQKPEFWPTLLETLVIQCYRAGIYKPPTTPMKRKRASNKCGCQFSIRVVEQHGKWEISSFNNVHNHNLFEGDEIYSISKMRKLTEPQEHSFFQQAKSNASNASVAKVLNGEDEGSFVTTKDVAKRRFLETFLAFARRKKLCCQEESQ